MLHHPKKATYVGTTIIRAKYTPDVELARYLGSKRCPIGLPLTTTIIHCVLVAAIHYSADFSSNVYSNVEPIAVPHRKI